MIHTEHLLNATRRPLTSRRARKPPRSWVEQNEKERNWDGACTPGKELWRKKGSRTPGSPSPAGRPVWMEGELQSLEGESAATSLRMAKWGVICTEGRHHHPALPSMRCSSVGVGGGWGLKLRLQRSDPGKGAGLIARRQPEEAGLWQLRVYSEGAWAHQWGWGAYKERGGTTIRASFPVSALRQ